MQQNSFLACLIKEDMEKRQIDKLLIKISRGDNEAFVSFYENTKRGVFHFLYSYLRNYEDTEDAMQTVYLKVKLNADKYRPGTNGIAWLLQIAKNQALNEIKSSKRTEYTETFTPVYEPEPLGEITETMQRVLTDEERYIVTLHVLWKYKHREIAKELGVPTGTVTSKYKRSIARLKNALKEEEE